MARSGRRVSRREFLEIGGAGLAALSVGGRSAASPRQGAALPAPGDSGIDHIVVVMMENRSFDHFAGWIPGANGQQAGLTYQDAAGNSFDTHPLAPDFQGCGHPDPDHSYEGGRIQYNGGACDGWLRSGNNDLYAIGFYTEADLPFFAGAARHFTSCDQYFSSIMSATFPNRMYLHAAQTDRLTNTFTLSTLPTIWDQLAAAGLSGRYYFSDAPFLALWGPKYLPISRPYAAFLQDCAAGTLPQVSFVEPRFIEQTTGIASDDHPHADVRNGQAFLNEVYTAVASSPAWRRTVLVITYDEWGGFFDHVPPPFAPIPPASAAAGDVDGQLGFRVPTFVISPLAGRSRIASTVFDHASILRMIEWRWDLTPLTIRDATANNLAEVLDFSPAKPRAPRLRVPGGNFVTACLPTLPDKWLTLLQLAIPDGWGL